MKQISLSFQVLKKTNMNCVFANIWLFLLKSFRKHVQFQESMFECPFLRAVLLVLLGLSGRPVNKFSDNFFDFWRKSFPFYTFFSLPTSYLALFNPRFSSLLWALFSRFVQFFTVSFIFQAMTYLLSPYKGDDLSQNGTEEHWELDIGFAVRHLALAGKACNNGKIRWT